MRATAMQARPSPAKPWRHGSTRTTAEGVFTGLIEQVGKVARIARRGQAARLSIACTLQDYQLGESIAVNGCCLTVDHFDAQGFEADASQETLERSTLGSLQPGHAVNLERALRPHDRLGGHFVSGHVDGVGSLLERSPLDGASKLRFAMPASLARYVAEKGSITVAGVSLTVNGADHESFHVALIPHTQSRTTLESLTVGDEVNLEIDLLARYVARLMGVESTEASTRDRKLLDVLRGAGYLPG